MEASAIKRKLGVDLEIDGARPSAWHWVLTEVPVAMVGTARGTPAGMGRGVKRGRQGVQPRGVVPQAMVKKEC